MIDFNCFSHSVEFVQERPHCPSGFSEGQTGEMNSYSLTKLENVVFHTAYIGFCLIVDSQQHFAE